LTRGKGKQNAEILNREANARKGGKRLAFVRWEIKAGRIFVISGRKTNVTA